MKNKVVIIFTGGTISMRVDPTLHAAIPSLNSEEIMAMVTNIENFAEIESINFGNLPSPHITPPIMMDLARIVKLNIEREDVTGVRHLFMLCNCPYKALHQHHQQGNDKSPG